MNLSPYISLCSTILKTCCVPCICIMLCCMPISMSMLHSVINNIFIESLSRMQKQNPPLHKDSTDLSAHVVGVMYEQKQLLMYPYIVG